MKSNFAVIVLTFFSLLVTAETRSQEVYISQAVRDWLAPSISKVGNKTTFESMRLLLVLKNGTSSQFSVLSQKRKSAENLQQLRIRVPALNNHRDIDELWAINGFVGDFSASEVTQLIATGKVASIHDANKKISVRKLPESVGFFPELNVDSTYGLKNIKVPDLKKLRPDLTGAGIKIGVLDTGIYAEHPDLKGRLGLYKNFSPSSDNSVRDPFGHGSHVSGTIAGGSKSNVAIGVAPQAELVVGRIFDGNGDSTKELILKAMQWMLDPDENPATTNDIPRAVNNSWGDSDPYNDRDPQDDPFCMMIESWLKAGIVPIFTAGNSGPRPKSINVPGACPGSVTIGATEQADRSPHFSSEGPTSWKTVEIIKPDLVAPGVAIKSVGNWGNEYEVMSGTSMAAPHVAGAFALLFQAKPELTNLEAIELMKAGVKDLGPVGKDTTFGFGRIDILKTVELSAAP